MLFNVTLKGLLVFQIKDSIVRSVSNIQVNNLQSLTQVTSVIARATLEPSEVTFDTQVCTALTHRVRSDAPPINAELSSSRGLIVSIT